jgi:hypothetical protein
MPGRDGPWVHDSRAADLVRAARLVDVAAEDELRLLALDEVADDRAAVEAGGDEPFAVSGEGERNAPSTRKAGTCGMALNDAPPEVALAKPFLAQRSGAGVEPTEPWVARPHRF